jgi:membrane protein
MKKYIKTIADSPVKTFAIVAAFFGLMTILVTPIFTGADEEAHFIRAWGISNGQLLLTSKNDNQVTMPKAFRKTIGCLQNKIATRGNVYEYKYDNYGKRLSTTARCSLSIEVYNNDTEEIRVSSANYSPAVYVPQLVAIYIGRTFNWPIFIIAYLVRIAVLAAYIVLVCLAIKLLINRKWALVGIALLPHSLMQITNPGADYILFGVAAILVAAIIRSRQLAEDDYLVERKKIMLITLVSMSLLMVPKGVFPGICFLPLIVFLAGVRKEIFMKVLIVLLALIVGAIWQKIASDTLSQAAGLGLASSVMSFPKSFIKTMFYTWANQDFIYKSIGLGLNNKVGLPSVAISLMNILVAFYIFVAVKAKEKVRSGKYFSWTAWLSTAAIIVGSFAAMHIVAYTLQSGDGIINGVQPRYFYPALFMLAIVPMRRYVYVNNENIYRNIVIAGSMVVLTAHLFAIMVKYYS